jgi:Early transcription elongation factor of RNA pol II, NGN section
VFQINRRTLKGDLSNKPTIASVFARPGIPGYIFIEGLRLEVQSAIRGMVTVYENIPPRLVPPEHAVSLLSPRNPLSGEFREGSWVRCRHGLYRDDVGLVQGHEPKSDESVIVALVPRIPNKVARSIKRKKVTRPSPRTWSPLQIVMEWGESRLTIDSSEECKFFNETYKHGLIIKGFSPANLSVAIAPPDLLPFVKASFIREMPSFGPMIRRHAQDTIQVNQRVRVMREEQRGLVGCVCDIEFDQAGVVPEDEHNASVLLVSLRSLKPEYRAGDKIRSRWSESSGIVQSVNESNNSLTYVENDTHIEVISISIIINVYVHHVF